MQVSLPPVQAFQEPDQPQQPLRSCFKHKNFLLNVTTNRHKIEMNYFNNQTATRREQYIMAHCQKILRKFNKHPPPKMMISNFEDNDEGDEGDEGEEDEEMIEEDLKNNKYSDDDEASPDVHRQGGLEDGDEPDQDGSEQDEPSF